ncbi:PilZ domain-containing protein [Shewanella algae]|uniref:PilZ domain-containing protein n=1 Tax=Shewanella algae TaxID=38313 RepID=UPI0038B29446
MDENLDDFIERRRSLRVDLEAERIRLHWLDKAGNEHNDDGVCIDLSRRGILFEYSQPFVLGELVSVTFHAGTDAQNTVKGQVCRCSESHPKSFHIAMQLI